MTICSTPPRSAPRSCSTSASRRCTCSTRAKRSRRRPIELLDHRRRLAACSRQRPNPLLNTPFLRRRVMNPITIRYSFRPRTRSLATGQVADLFGLDEQEPPHAVAVNVVLDIRPGDLVLFTGSSGSGKSSLLRAAGAQLDAIDANALDLPHRPLIDALSGTVEERLKALAACGLSEARLLLR